MTTGKYITSTEQITEGIYYGLPYEVALMEQQMAELAAKQHDIAGHIAEAMEQSSETWHDNAPADALFGELKILDQQVAKFRAAQRKLNEVEYPTDNFKLVTIGSRALCSMMDDQFQVDVTGNLPLQMIEADGDVEIASIAAPIPRAILGAQAGSSVEADLNGRLVPITVLDIDQHAQRAFYEQAS